jgi:hypothetical protein
MFPKVLFLIHASHSRSTFACLAAFVMLWTASSCASEPAASGGPSSGSPSATAGQVSAGAGGGPASAAPPVAGDGGGAERLTFTELYERAFWTCKKSICHGGAVAGLDMSSPQAAHAALVNQPAQGGGMCAFTGMTRVVPFEPDASLLVGKLQPTAPCGQQMPIGGLLPEQDRLAVRAWIEAGAPID